MNGWSWLMLLNFLNPFKQATVSPGEPPALYFLLSDPRHSTRNSQLRFTAWLLLGISKPSTSNSHLRLLYSSGRVAKHRWELTLACTTQEIPGPAQPMDSYRPHRSSHKSLGPQGFVLISVRWIDVSG